MIISYSVVVSQFLADQKVWVWICMAAASQSTWMFFPALRKCKQEWLICHSALFHLLSSSHVSLCLLDRCCDTVTEFLFHVEHTAEGLLWCVKCFCSAHSLPSFYLFLCDKDTPLQPGPPPSLWFCRYDAVQPSLYVDAAGAHVNEMKHGNIVQYSSISPLLLAGIGKLFSWPVQCCSASWLQCWW